MSNIIGFLKDKIYYILGITVVIIILLIAITACSNTSKGGKSYKSMEESMVSAAKEYYSKHKKNLPKEGVTIKVSSNTLIDEEYLDKLIDPKDSSNECSGYVEVTKEDGEYSYLPFLTCKGNYEPKYLNDVVKNVKTDEYGNGVYEINGDYIYRGKDVNNYIKFNDQLWRIIKVDSEGDIKIVLLDMGNRERYVWDDTYNSDIKGSYGNNTVYLKAAIRKTLGDYYEENFSKENKAKIASKTICVGRMSLDDEFSVDKECSVIQEKEKIGLLNATDYKNASLDNGCVTLTSGECRNYNYLSNSDEFNTWILNASTKFTYKCLYLSDIIYESYCNSDKKVSPVVYVSSKSIISEGNGTKDNPYILK